jgi:hypothetical protein
VIHASALNMPTSAIRTAVQELIVRQKRRERVATWGWPILIGVFALTLAFSPIWMEWLKQVIPRFPVIPITQTAVSVAEAQQEWDRAPLIPIPEGLTAEAWAMRYPANSREDVRSINRSIRNAVSDLCHDKPGRSCIIWFVTQPSPLKDRSLSIVNFAASNDPAVKALRDDAAIRSPDGSAVIRRFSSTPLELVKFVGDGDHTTAVAVGRYIASFREGYDLPEVLRHELVHAYISTASGDDVVYERWFSEGVALWLARNPVQSLISGNVDRAQLAILSADYIEFRRVFDWLAFKYGRKRLLKAIGDSVHQHSESPLLRLAGARDYGELKSFAHNDLYYRVVGLDRVSVAVCLVTALLIGWMFYRGRTPKSA